MKGMDAPNILQKMKNNIYTHPLLSYNNKDDFFKNLDVQKKRQTKTDEAILNNFLFTAFFLWCKKIC